MGIHSCIQTYEQTDKQKPIHTYIHIARYQKKRLNTDSDAQSRPGHVELPRHTSQTTSNDIKRHIHEATLLWCQNSQTNRCSYFFHASHLHHRKRAGKPYTNCNRCAGQLYVKLMCRIWGILMHVVFKLWRRALCEPKGERDVPSVRFSHLLDPVGTFVYLSVLFRTRSSKIPGKPGGGSFQV